MSSNSTTYRVEYIVSQRYTAEIQIPNALHPSKRADYIQFHLDSLTDEQAISGTHLVAVDADAIAAI